MLHKCLIYNFINFERRKTDIYENYLENSDEQTNPLKQPNTKPLIMTLSVMSVFCTHFHIHYFSLSNCKGLISLPDSLLPSSNQKWMLSVMVWRLSWLLRLCQPPCCLVCHCLSLLFDFFFISLDWQAVVFCCLIPACVLVISSHFLKSLQCPKYHYVCT